MLNAQPLVYVIGDLQAPWCRSEFAEAAGWLARYAQAKHFANCDLVVAEIDGGINDPHAVILLQNYAGQLNHDQASTLRQRLPLTDFFVLHGHWCEGETRTGHPLVGFTRLAWYDFVPRMAAFWGNGTDESQRRVPLTASDAERWRGDLAQATADISLQVGVLCASYDGEAAIWQSLVAAGYSAARIDLAAVEANRTAVRSRPWDVVLWDDVGGTRTFRAGLADVVRIVAPTPVLALMTFPRTHDLAEASAVGAQAVLAKPYQTADLVWRIQSVASPAIRLAKTSAA